MPAGPGAFRVHLSKVLETNESTERGTFLKGAGVTERKLLPNFRKSRDGGRMKTRHVTPRTSGFLWSPHGLHSLVTSYFLP